MSFLANNTYLRSVRNHILKHQLSSAFVLISAVFGIYFVFTIPLFWGADETSHTARVYELSHGNLRAAKVKHTRQQGGYGGYIPENMYALILNVNHDQINNLTDGTPVKGVKNVDDANVYKELGKRKLENGKYVLWGFPNTAAYSPVAYVPAIIGMKIADAAHVDMGQMIYIMRLCNLLFFIAAVYIALRILEQTKIKWLFFVIALLPMSLFEASFVTADTMTIALVLLFAAIVIRSVIYANNYVLSRPELVLLAATVVLIPILKPGYILLTFTALLIPAAAIPFKKLQTQLGLLSLVGAGLIPFLLWTYAVRDVSNSAALIRPEEGWQLVNSHEQLHGILHEPYNYFVTFLRTLLLKDTKYFNELLGGLGFNFVLLPGSAIVALVAAMLLALGLSENVAVSKLKKMALYVLPLATVAIIFTGMYLTYDSVGDPIIFGIQGRYFLPLLPFILSAIALTWSVRLAPRIRPTAQLSIYGLVVFALTLTAVKYTYVTLG